MIEVRYKGGLGNNLFQYCLGRILAENLGFRLKADPIPGFPNTKVQIGGCDYSGYPVQTLKDQIIDLPSILSDKSERKIVLEGCFQRYEYYKAYKEKIKNDWLTMDIPVKDRTSPKDIAVCIRRGDYVPEHALVLSYYEDTLRMADYGKVFICTDSPWDPFIFKFKRRHNAVVRFTNALDDFAFITKFKKIVISKSTFHWWAAFLSKAEEIYYPVPSSGRWSADSDIDLKIDDEARFHYIKCKEEYKISFTDRLILLKRKLLRPRN